MADLTAERRKTKSHVGSQTVVYQPTMVTGGTVYKGGLVQITTAGLASRAGAANPKFVLGRALETYVAAAAGQTVRVEAGTFLWDNLGGDPLLVADIGTPCYVTDDQTVHQTDGGADLIAGTVIDVTSEGVYVETRMPVNSGITAP